MYSAYLITDTSCCIICTIHTGFSYRGGFPQETHSLPLDPSPQGITIGYIMYAATQTLRTETVQPVMC